MKKYGKVVRMIKVAIVEDDQASANLIKNFLKKYQDEENEKFEVKHYANGLLFLGNNCSVFDIIFMDIEMPELNGLETAKQLRKLDENACLIFITNIANYAIEGYKVNAMDFMVKPINYFQFSTRLKKAVALINKDKNSSILLNFEQGFIRIFIRDIRYVEVRTHFLIYHLANSKYEIRGSLKKAEEELKPYGFIRCNYCYLINLHYVSGIYNNIVTVGKADLQISHSRKKDLLSALTNYVNAPWIKAREVTSN